MEKAKRSRIKRDFISTLSSGETLLIKRRRKKLKQKQAAKEYGVSVFHYNRIECDKVKSVKSFKLLEFAALKPHEKCLIYRKRENLKQQDIANALKISRLWLRLQENGEVPCKKLLNWWEDRSR